jgi:hypothetical protein
MSIAKKWRRITTDATVLRLSVLTPAAAVRNPHKDEAGAAVQRLTTNTWLLALPPGLVITIGPVAAPGGTCTLIEASPSVT